MYFLFRMSNSLLWGETPALKRIVTIRLLLVPTTPQALRILRNENVTRSIPELQLLHSGPAAPYIVGC